MQCLVMLIFIVLIIWKVFFKFTLNNFHNFPFSKEWPWEDKRTLIPVEKTEEEQGSWTTGLSNYLTWVMEDKEADWDL